MWGADQTESVQRTVALKVLKAGMDSHQIVARFQAERQALGVMDHPSIATVFDAGTTPGGRPYFVMERVPGLPTSSSSCQTPSLRPTFRSSRVVRAVAATILSDSRCPAVAQKCLTGTG